MIFSGLFCIESKILSSFQKYKFYINPSISTFVQITTPGPTVGRAATALLQGHSCRGSKTEH